MIIDNALKQFDEFRAYCDGVDYAGIVNPVDGVEYPGISVDIPDSVKQEFYSVIEREVGFPITPNTTFLRLSLDDEKAPHQAHNDSTMGDYTALMYMNRKEDCKGGTSLVTHLETGMSGQPETAELVDIWERDTNDYGRWSLDKLFDMKSNRLVIFEAQRMHRAEPPKGFGRDAKGGRLVLICFFEAQQ